MRVKFLDQSRMDLMECGQYYQEVGGASLVRKMLARIKPPILALRDTPEIAPYYDIASDIRCLVVAGGAFLVFYRVRVDVEVLHIRRAEREPFKAQDLAKLV